jgi:agmatine deiminase
MAYDSSDRPGRRNSSVPGATIGAAEDYPRRMTTRPAWRMPAEWEPHERCLMAWPTRASIWHDVEVALAEYAGVANAIAGFEPVLMVANPGDGPAARRLLAAGVDVLELPIDDSWMRDNGPIFVVDDRGGRAGVHFAFNAWGERFPPWDKDAAVGEPLLAQLGIERIASRMVLEGGSISVDGEGTLVTTEQCLLNPNRNPDMDREQIERELRERLGVENVLWLPFGHAEDMHTDGHVDGVCAFIRPGVVVAQTCPIPGHPDAERMAANRDVLATARDARGRALEVVELPQYPYVDVGGTRTRVSYANFYLANGAVIVPLAGHAFDAEVLEILAAAMPEREVVGVRASTIASGGGGVHCITQQVPASVA